MQPMRSHPFDQSRRHFLKALGAGAAAMAAAGLPNACASAVRKPNLIFILADDLGWAELGCFGNIFNETPHLDGLARAGMRFTDAYAAAPVCSPYRAALMTGQYPARIGITDYLRPDSPVHLDAEYPTLAAQLRKAGYATGIVGKWHLTGYAHHGAEEFGPDKHGFNEVLVSERRGIGGGSYFHPYHFNPGIEQRLPGREHLPERCNLEALEFIDRHKDEPFFLYLSHYAVHTKLDGKPDLVQKYEEKAGAGKGFKAPKNNPHLAAQLEVIDNGVGQIREKLEALGLEDNTIIVFTGDNGGEDRVTTNGILRAGKSTLYEGGIRVPLILWGPGVIPGNEVCSALTSNVDFYPTLLACAGAKVPEDTPIDGVSLTPLFENPAGNLGRQTLYWHYPLEKPHFLGGRSAGALRSGNWKLIEFFDSDTIELYELGQDPGEEHELSAQIPDKAAALRRQLHLWRESLGVRV